MVISKNKNKFKIKYIKYNINNSLKKKCITFSSSTKNKTIGASKKRRSIFLYRATLTSNDLKKISNIKKYKNSMKLDGLILIKLKNIFLKKTFGTKLYNLRNLENPFSENKSHLFLTPINSDKSLKLDLDQAKFYIDILVIFKKKVDLKLENISTIHESVITDDQEAFVLNWTSVYSGKGKGGSFIIPRTNTVNFLQFFIQKNYPDWVIISDLSFFCCPQGKNLKEDRLWMMRLNNLL